MSGYTDVPDEHDPKAIREAEAEMARKSAERAIREAVESSDLTIDGQKKGRNRHG